MVEIYKDDLPASNNCQEEFIQWEKKWSVCDIWEGPQATAQALKQYDNDAYLNLSILLKIAGTVTVMSCKCERSGSILKCLNTYLRQSMRLERLSGLALMQINYDVEISVDRATNFC